MKRMLLLLCLLAMAALTACTLAESPYEKADTPLTLFAINVGKGDALLLNCGGDTYLIDTGLQDHWGEVSRALKVLQVEHLTGVILTHTDKDHAGGLMPLATSSIQVDAWYASSYYADVKPAKHPAVQVATLRDASVTFLRAGDVLPLGTGRLTVIGPTAPSEKENCNSLVLVAEAGGGRMLLTGDMEFPEEELLLSANAIPRCDVLKVGNHGNADATSEALMQAVRPQIALISTATAEDPDTPSDRVMHLLAGYGAEVYVTGGAPSGVLVTLDQGEVTANPMNYADLPAPLRGVIIDGVDREDDRITLRNTGSREADLSGWYLHSDRGNQLYVLPAGTRLAPGATLVISSLSSDAPGDLVWPDKKVWHKTKEDRASLYDVYGREMDGAD